MRATCLATLFVVAIASRSARADGLIYRLPEDGTSVNYDMEITSSKDGEDRSLAGRLSISSVGTTTVDKEPCRWLEFKTVVRDGTLDRHAVAKVLIPERYLGKGQAPGEHLIRGWVKDGESRPLEIKDLMDPVAGGLLLYLAGPAKHPEKLEPAPVDSRVGKIRAGGVAGDFEFARRTVVVKARFETRLADQSPFGAIASSWKFERTNDGRLVEAGTIKLSLAEVRTDASTDLPDRD